MSGLGAFFRGAAGPGVLNLLERMDRASERDLVMAEREQERERERQFRAEQARLEREARYGLTGPRGPSRQRTASGDVIDAEDMEMDTRRDAALALSEKHGMSLPEAEAAVEGVLTGKNPYSKSGTKVEQIDDGDRMRNVTVNTSEPDIERFKAVARDVAFAMRRAKNYGKSNAEQRASGEYKDWQRGVGEEAIKNPERQGVLAGGVMASAGTDQSIERTKAQAKETTAEAAQTRANRPPAPKGGSTQQRSKLLDDVTRNLSSMRTLLPKAKRAQRAGIESDIRALEDYQRQLRDWDGDGQPPAAPKLSTAGQTAKVPDRQAAEKIKKMLADGKITRDDALSRLRELGFQ